MEKPRRSLPARLVERARIILAAASGKQDLEIAVEIGISIKSGALAQTFLGSAAARAGEECPRPGRTPTIQPSKVRRIVEMTTRSKPANATHRSTRTMAAEAGVSKARVRRIWRANGLKPHLVESFKINNDPEFADKLESIVGLYLNPPEHALVLCVDEKSQIQALDRTPPGLPLKRGRGAHHDARLQAEWNGYAVRGAQQQQRRVMGFAWKGTGIKNGCDSFG